MRCDAIKKGGVQHQRIGERAGSRTEIDLFSIMYNAAEGGRMSRVSKRRNGIDGGLYVNCVTHTFLANEEPGIREDAGKDTEREKKEREKQSSLSISRYRYDGRRTTELDP